MTGTPPRPVRTRFAPSPTGPLHIGGARTALFGWLFARHHGGQFILRIEDTDQKRFDPQSLDQIINGLRWLGIDWDEGPDIGGPYAPYKQSERLEYYHQWAHWLVEHDKAYRCYCSAERLEQLNQEKLARKEPPGYDRRCRYLTSDERAALDRAGTPYVIRFKMPLEGKTVVHDLIRGEVVFDNSTQQDMVLLKQDGYPTYHLAHIVDDYMMCISHVTRANEWLPSLALHVQIWQAFGWDMPQFAHLPVLLNPNGKGKLSKRHAGYIEDGRQVLVLVDEYRQAGYLPQAVINFLTNIGWNFGDEREVFSVQEAIERFDLSRVNPANSVFPIEKLDWLNGIYIRNLSLDELAAHLRPPLERAGLVVDEELLRRVAPLVQIRIKTLNDVVEIAGFFFRPDFKLADAEALIPERMDAKQTQAALERAYQVLADLDDFSHTTTEAAIRQLADQLGIKPKHLFSALRVAVTGQKVATPLFETMEILGKATCLERIKLAHESLVCQP